MFPLRDDNPIHITPIVTISLIVANVLVFFYQLSLEAGGGPGARAGQLFIEEFGLVPCRLTG
ncbi:MAG: rhomboid family intramembrane serine protease, partial [Candidatus Rokuibacteriota bacterium]